MKVIVLFSLAIILGSISGYILGALTMDQDMIGIGIAFGMAVLSGVCLGATWRVK